MVEQYLCQYPVFSRDGKWIALIAELNERDAVLGLPPGSERTPAALRQADKCRKAME